MMVSTNEALLDQLKASQIFSADELQKAVAAGGARKPLDRHERRSVLALAALFVPTTLFWATYEQSGNTIALWADDYTDRYIDLVLWKGEIPVTWFQAVNPFLIFAFTPFVVALWARQAERARERTTSGGMGVSLDPPAYGIPIVDRGLPALAARSSCGASCASAGSFADAAKSGCGCG